MKRLLRIVSVVLLSLSLVGTSYAQQTSAPLTNLDFTIVGVGIGVSPDYQAVPKGINSQVLTALSVGDVDVNEIIKLLPQDYTVRAELTGPAFSAREAGDQAGPALRHSDAADPRQVHPEQHPSL